MTPVQDPQNPEDRPEPGREPGREPEAPAIPGGVVAVAALAAGLLGGYLLFGRGGKAPASNTLTALYSADTVANAAPSKLGPLVTRALPTLDSWDPLDPFAGGFPLPPADWTPPLLALNPPIPLVETPAAPGGTVPPPLTGDGFAGGPRMDPPSLGGEIPNLPPMNPGMIPGDLIPEGTVPNGNAPGGTTPPPSTNPGTGAPPKTTPPPQSSGGRLVLATMTGVDLDAASRAAAALAPKYAGAARGFSHMDADGNVEAKGVVLLVAPSDVPKLLADLKKLGDLSVEDDSRGSASARQSKLTAPLSARLNLLQKRRSELLVQFLEDADPVKNVEAAIDQEARAVSAVRLSGPADRLAAVRVFFKS